MAGTRLFLSGEIAYATDVNNFLMDQVIARFTDVAQRDLAFGDGIAIALGGDGKPLLTTGQFCYLIDRGDGFGEVQYWDGDSWVSSSQFTIADGVIIESKIATGAVTSTKIAPNSIESSHIAPGTVITSDIDDGQITEAKIADSAVTSAKIADGAIVNADINASAAIALTKLSGTAANLRTALGSESTGTGDAVFATSPTLATPTLGVASATSVNKLAITAPSTGATLTLADGSTFQITGAFSVNLTATAGTSVTLPTSGTLATLAGGETLTNKTIASPTISGLYLSDSSITFEGSSADAYETTISVVDPTADRTITVPNVTGTIVTTGDSGTVSNTMLSYTTVPQQTVSTSAPSGGKQHDIWIKVA